MLCGCARCVNCINIYTQGQHTAVLRSLTLQCIQVVRYGQDADHLYIGSNYHCSMPDQVELVDGPHAEKAGHRQIWCNLSKGTSTGSVDCTAVDYRCRLPSAPNTASAPIPASAAATASTSIPACSPASAAATPPAAAMASVPASAPASASAAASASDPACAPASALAVASASDSASAPSAAALLFDPTSAPPSTSAVVTPVAAAPILVLAPNPPPVSCPDYVFNQQMKGKEGPCGVQVILFHAF